MTAPINTPELPAVTLTRAELRDLISTAVREELLALDLNPPALLTAKAMARELAISDRTLHELRRKGLPTVWVGASPRFELEAVITWLRKRPAP